MTHMPDILEKAETGKDSERRLQGLIGKAETTIGQEYQAVVINMRQVASLEELEALIESGQINQAVQLVAARPLIRPLADTINVQFALAAESTASLIERQLDVFIRFDLVNQDAVRAMRQNQLRLVTGFQQEQVNATRQALLEGIRKGENPIQQARRFRDAIGLTQKQVLAVENYKRLLEQGSSEALRRTLRDKRSDRAVRRALEEGKPLPSFQIDKMVDRYRNRMIKHRSEVIARTEALRSVHEGSQEMFRQAIGEGILDANTLTREWVTAGDERVRGSHVSMNGQQRKINESFVSGAGNSLRWPGDAQAPAEEVIQCRCVVVTTFTEVS